MSIIKAIVSPVGVNDFVTTGSPVREAWDVVLGGIPFMLSPSREFPFRIKAIGQTLYRYDTSNQAGEQTLGAWWLRSQTSFHGGAGQTYLDGTDPTISTDVATLRFSTCQGIDVWTPGAVSLLHDVTKIYTSASSGIKLMEAMDGTTPVLFYSDGATLYRYDGTQTAVTWGGSGTILALAQDGSNYYAADSTGVYRGTLAGGAGTLIWKTGSSAVQLAWLKQRLMGAVGTEIVEFDNDHRYIADPTTVAGTFTGTAGTTDRIYAVAAYNEAGDPTTAVEVTVHNTAATLDASDYVSLSWDNMGADHYAVFVVQAAGSPPAQTPYLLKDSITGTSYADNGTDTAAGTPASVGLISANKTGGATQRYTQPLSGWSWDALADGPEAIYAAGHSGSHSVIYKFVLDNTGGVPALTTGIAAVTTPNGVLVKSLVNHSDSWMGVGTDQGLYVAQFASGGDLSLALLRNDLGGDVVAMTTRDRFIYANYTAGDGVGTLARIDLSFEIKSGLYAWAPDLRADAGSVSQLALYNDKIAFVVDGQGVYVEASTYVAEGTLTTSRVRFDTSEAKIFNAVRWHGAGPGEIACSVSINSDANGRLLGTLSSGSGFDSFDTPILQPGGDFTTLIFTLTADSTGTPPTLSGWLVKALPMQSRSYQILLPLRCFDKEKLGNGQLYGHVGWSLERVDDVMQLADEQKAQILQQIAGPKDQRRALRVVIDDLDFIQTDPPHPESGTGGILYLTARTV